MPDLFTIESDALSPTTHVVAFRGVEGLSKLFQLEIGLLLQNHLEVDLDAATAARAALTIHRQPAEPDQVFAGILASVELVHAWGDQSLYRAVLVPRWWSATLTHHSRVFVDMSIPDVVEKVLADSGVTYELRLNGSYDRHEHVCQYQESDFAFVSRWLEREGMFYFFEHEADGDKLIICDHLGYEDPLSPVAVQYTAMTGNQAISGDSLATFLCRRSMLPASVTLTDYDYMKPSLSLEGQAAIATQGDLVVHNENFKTNGDAARLAKVRAEERLCQQKVFHGMGRVFNLRPGYKLAIEDHPQASMNRGYLCTELQHHGNQSANDPHIRQLLQVDYDEEYIVHLTAIGDDVQFRPPRATPIPRIEGVLHALVDGAGGGPYAQLDGEGRYRVRLMLDEGGNAAGEASMWVRMMQFHAGGTEGVHFPLRKGTEVMLVFLGGDPDRPVICGAVPNPQKPSPVTSSNSTRNILVTGSNNYIEMEDAVGGQWIDISTPASATWVHMGMAANGKTHEYVVHTDANALFDIAVNQDIEVGGTLYEHAVGTVTEVYDSDQDSEVAGNQTLEVTGNRDVEVGGDQTVEIAGDFDTEVGGDTTLDIGGNYDIEVDGDSSWLTHGDWQNTVLGNSTWDTTGNLVITAEGDITVRGASNRTTHISGNDNTTIGGNQVLNVAGTQTISITGPQTEDVGGQYWSTTFGNKGDLKVGSFLELALAAKIGLTAGVDISAFVGVKLAFEAALSLTATMGAKLELDGSVDMKARPVEIDMSATKIEQKMLRLSMSAVDLFL